MEFQEVRHAGEYVGPGSPQVDTAIAIAVARVGANAARHELRCAHGTRVRTGDHQRVHAMFTR